jgi:hypothetical protein
MLAIRPERGHIAAMSRHPVQMRLLAALCLLLFQLQVFAAGTLGCVHDADGQPPALGCGHMLGGVDAAGPSSESGDGLDLSSADCQKCNLSLCAAGWHLLAGQTLTFPAVEVAAPTPLPSRHFYLYSPDGLLKPPISVSG